MSPRSAEKSPRPGNAGRQVTAGTPTSEALRVMRPGLRTLTDRLTESGAAAIRSHLTTT
jgi:hypothetical protein